MIIGVIGGRECTEKGKNSAFEIGKEIAQLGAYLVCGGYSGVMEAACKGAKSQNGTTIGILMHEDKRDMNPYIDIPIITAMSHARNAIIVRTSDILVAIEGSYGTLSEIGLALASGKTIIGINTWSVKDQIKTAQNTKQAIELLQMEIKNCLI